MGEDNQDTASTIEIVAAEADLDYLVKMSKFEGAKSPSFTPPTYTRSDYDRELAACDAAVCEAIAVSQKTASRLVDAHIGYSTKVFSQMCGHANSMMRAAPRSRWVRADFENWHFSAVAGHARAIVEGYLLFIYLTDSPASDAEMRARINVLHLADCVKRIEFLSETAAAQDHIDYYIDQRKVIQARLEKNEFFTGLSPTVRRSCLSGKKMMIRSRDQLLEATGYEKEQFDALYDLLSQHTHILTMSFYRMEPNGRGTGIENDVDRSYIGVTLKLCAEILELATARLIGLFPDALFVCNGLKSKFCPGPAENMQIKVSVDRTGGKSSRELPSHTTLVLAIHKSLVNAVELTSKHLCWYYNPATWYSAMPLLKIR